MKAFLFFSILLFLVTEVQSQQVILRTSGGKILKTPGGIPLRSSCGTYTVTDVDGNTYTTVSIGTQCWLGENLRTTKLNDNIAISTSWSTSTPSYVWHSSVNTPQLRADCGALYNYSAANSGKLCPSGWHVPTDAEWITLSNYLGGDNVAGGKLKETGYTYWMSPNLGATNESGFTGRGAGDATSSGASSPGYKGGGFFWCGNSNTYRNLNYNTTIFSRIDNNYGNIGLSVRCLKN